MECGLILLFLKMQSYLFKNFTCSACGHTLCQGQTKNLISHVNPCPSFHGSAINNGRLEWLSLLLLLALGGCSWPSLMHELTHDFLVVHIKASQKSLGDKPKSVREVYTRKS